jgi:hypothetical protein
MKIIQVSYRRTNTLFDGEKAEIELTATIDEDYEKVLNVVDDLKCYADEILGISYDDYVNQSEDFSL